MVVAVRDRLEFYDSEGTLTRTEKFKADGICFVTYDPVHNRVLYVDSNDDELKSSIFSFEIATKKIECLVRNTNYVVALVYDPATELLFWVENSRNVYSMSLKLGVNEKHLILSDETDFIDTIAVDSFGGYVTVKNMFLL